MQIYSKRAIVRTRQIVADVVAIAAIVFFVVLGSAARGAIDGLAAFGQQVESSASNLQGTLGDAATTLGSIPLVGESASQPLRGASSAAASLAEAGRQQQQLVGGVAITVGLLVALIPIAIIALVWLRRRVGFVRRAAGARALAGSPGGLDCLALQALVKGDFRDIERTLRAVGSAGVVGTLGLAGNPVQGWRVGDAGTIRALADRALRDAGVL